MIESFIFSNAGRSTICCSIQIGKLGSRYRGQCLSLFLTRRNRVKGVCLEPVNFSCYLVLGLHTQKEPLPEQRLWSPLSRSGLSQSTFLLHHRLSTCRRQCNRRAGQTRQTPALPPREGRFASHPCVVLSGPNIASDQLRDGGRYGYSLSRLPIAGSWPELPEAGTDITLLFVMARVGSTRCNIITALAEPAAVEIGYGRCPFSTAPFSDSSLSFSSA